MSTQDARLRQVQDEISARLRVLCSHMTDPDFDTMVRKIAENQLRDERGPMWKVPEA